MSLQSRLVWSQPILRDHDLPQLNRHEPQVLRDSKPPENSEEPHFQASH